MPTLPPSFVSRTTWHRLNRIVMRYALSLVVLAGLTLSTSAQIRTVPAIRTAAGTASQGYSGDGANAVDGQISMAHAVTVDTKGNLYIADTGNHVIRKVDRQTGLISTVAGNGTNGTSGTFGDGGPATDATLSNPNGVVVDATGNLFISDTITNRIRRVDGVTGRISAYAGNGFGNSTGDGGQATAAGMYSPRGLAVDAAGNLFVADYQNFRIRRIDATTHVITTVAGSGLVNAISGDGGTATSAQIGEPLDVAVDASGNLYIVADGQSIVRKVTASTGTISTIAGSLTSTATPGNGDGAAATAAHIPSPVAVDLDADGNVYITENASGLRVIRKVDALTGVITTVAGDGSIGIGPDDIAATSSPLENPYGIAIDAAGYLYVSDWYRIRTVDPATGSALFPATQIKSNAAQNVLLQLTSAQSITSIAAVPSQGNVTEYAVGTVTGCTVNGSTSNAANTICTVPITFKPGYPGIRNVPLKVVTSAGTYYAGLSGLGIGPQVAFTAGSISTVAGDGTQGYAGDGGNAASAKLKQPYGVTTDKAGNLYISDTQNSRIRKMDAVTGVISTVAGNGVYGFSGDGGLATDAKLSFIFGSVKLDDAGNIYIPDSQNNRVRKVDVSTGIITTVAGSNSPSNYSGDGGPATAAGLLGPAGLAIDHAGNIYIADSGNGSVRKVNASNGIITTIAGRGVSGFDYSNGPATSLYLFRPTDLALDASGTLYIADTYAFTIRKVDASTGIMTMVAGARRSSQASSGDEGPATDATFDGPFGLALDAAGNIYLTDGEHTGSPTAVTNNRIRKVDAATGIIHTIAGIGAGDGTVTYSGDGGPATEATLSAPNGITVDNLGNIYFADLNNNAIRKIDVNASSLTFASTEVGATSADSPKIASLSNIGNDALSIRIPSTGLNPSISAGFTLSSTETTACPVVGSLASTPSQVAAGGSCTVTVSFVPQAPGTIHGSIAFNDNALNTGTGTVHSIALNGVGTSPAASITFAVADHTYGDAPFAVLATSNSTGAITYSVVSGPVTLSGNTVTLTGIGTVVLKAAQVADANYAAGSQTTSFTVVAAAPTLSFVVADHSFGDAPFTVAATSNSNGAITYSVQSGPATMVGNTVTLTGAGPVTLKATQAASGSYTSGTQTATFQAASVAPTIAFSVANHSFGDAPFSIAATSNSTGAISYSVVSGPATVSGSIVTVTGVGTVQLQASQAAAGNYAAGTQHASFNVAGITPAIALSIGTHTFGDAPFAVAATSNSTGAISYAIVSGPATLAGSTITLTGSGDVVVQASQVANGNYLAGTQDVSFHVNQATLIITASNTTRVYGTSNPSFTGTITGGVNGDTFTESFSTAATLTSAVNSYPIIPSASGAHLSFYTQSIHNGTLTITQAGTVTSLSASSSTITPGASVTLTAQVASKTTGVPTGTVTFFDGGTALGTSPMTDGAASYVATALSASATHVITAMYSGDANFTTSNSGSSVGIGVASLDFTIASTGSASQTVVPGDSANFSFTVSPKYGTYPAAVSFTVIGLPANASYAITPSTLSATSGPQTVTVTITTARAVAMHNSSRGSRGAPLAALVLLLLPGFAVQRLRRSGFSLVRCGLLCVVGFATFATVASLSGCGSSYGFLGQAPKDYAVTITATSGSVQHTSTVTLNVQ